MIFGSIRYPATAEPKKPTPVANQQIDPKLQVDPRAGDEGCQQGHMNEIDKPPVRHLHARPQTGVKVDQVQSEKNQSREQLDDEIPW
jgi:hypothetical protein